MRDKTRREITACLHLVQREVATEANKVSHIRTLLGEYLSQVSIDRPPPTPTRRLRRVEDELRRFAGVSSGPSALP